MRPYLRVANVFEDRIDLSDVMEMNFSPDEYAQYVLNYGDILLNEGQSRHLVGRPAMYRDELPGVCFTNSLVRFVCSEAVLPEYALAVFRHYLHSGRFEKIAKWTTAIAHLGAERFAALEFPVSPLAEQRRIVAKLEDLLARARRARAALEAIPPLLDRFRQSVLEAAFSGHLSKDWRDENRTSSGTHRGPSREEVRREAQVAHGIRPTRPATLTTDEPHPAVPASWQWVSVDEIAWDITVGFVGPMKQHYRPSGVKFLRSMNVKRNRIEEGDSCFITPSFDREIQKSALRPGDVVTVRTGTPGITAVIPPDFGVGNCSDLVITRLTSLVDPELFAFFMNSNLASGRVELQKVGIAQGHFNVGSMRKFAFPLMPIGEQKYVVKRLQFLLSSVNTLPNRIRELSAKLAVLEASALSKAFRGELVPQDPSDEPAPVLLERIRAERAASGADGKKPRRSPKRVKA